MNLLQYSHLFALLYIQNNLQPPVCSKPCFFFQPPDHCYIEPFPTLRLFLPFPVYSNSRVTSVKCLNLKALWSRKVLRERYFKAHQLNSTKNGEERISQSESVSISIKTSLSSHLLRFEKWVRSSWQVDQKASILSWLFKETSCCWNIFHKTTLGW